MGVGVCGGGGGRPYLNVRGQEMDSTGNFDFVLVEI